MQLVTKGLCRAAEASLRLRNLDSFARRLGHSLFMPVERETADKVDVPVAFDNATACGPAWVRRDRRRDA